MPKNSLVPPRVVCRMLNRREMRVRTRAPAIISPDAEPITCAVRDLSERGARLRLRRAASVPDRFEILFPETGTRRLALLRWTDGQEIGVEFAARAAGAVVPAIRGPSSMT
jgi:hypothetical protein